METATKRVRIGVVGGGFGTSFYWHEHPNSRVEAVSDLLPGRRNQLMQVYRCGKSYESLEQLLLDKDVDAVAVCTGAPDHVRHVVACLRAGKHVICAVPAAMNIAECEELAQTVQETGLTYMMAETSWYHQSVISARQWFAEGKFGDLFYTEAEYHHPGLDALYFDDMGRRTWRYGFPPMHYPTHCTAYLIGVTGERMTEVSCLGWGDASPFLQDNAYQNPFWSETAFFTTEHGHAFRVGVYWKAAVGGTERGQWIGDQMSFFDGTPNGLGYVIRRATERTEKDDAGFERHLSAFENYTQPEWWQTELLPESLRHKSGHGGSHTFLTHEFVDALVHGRAPAIGVREALNMTAPGIIAHESALHQGQQGRFRSFEAGVRRLAPEFILLDQPIWAHLSFGLGCSGAIVPYDRLSVRALHAAITKTLTSSRHRQAAEAVGSKIQTERGADAAVARINRLLAPESGGHPQ